MSALDAQRSVFRLFHRAFLLNLAGGMCFLICSKVMGVADGFDSYLSEAGSHLVSPQAAIAYALYLVAYASTMELCLRFIQRKLLTWVKLSTAGAVVALLYAICHLHHGWTGFVYALLVGSVTAYCYSRWRDTLSLVVWHVQWDLGTIFVFGVLALCNQPPYVTSLNYHYKLRLHQHNRIVYQTSVGWIDAAHYWGAQRWACELHQQLKDDVKVAHITIQQKDLLGLLRSNHIAVERQPTTEPLHSEVLQLTFEVAEQHERWQASSAIWTGLRMSGGSNEDMRSVSSALREIEEIGERFWERCEVRLRPMPEGFLPPNIQAEPWPTYVDFSLRGLP